MSSKRKALRYEQKNSGQTQAQSRALRQQVLRSLMAVGFAVTPWLGGEVWAADNVTGNIVRVGGTENLLQNGRADIFAESASGKVGLNRFEQFIVGNNDITNMYFRTANDAAALDTLVNTVNNRIDIYGTVNAIRNNKVGGNLYFLSPKGMVVGAGGVINAGSLTVMTADKKFDNAEDAAKALSEKDNWDLDNTAAIDIHGKINTATGIDLRAAYINVSKAAEADSAPLLQTGVLFDTTVNNDRVTSAAVKEGRLTASIDENGKVVIFDPSNNDGETLQGDGSIKLKASAKHRNTNTEFLGDSSYTNTVEAKATVGEGAKIDALGNVEISAEATVTNATDFEQWWHFMGFSKADVNVNGTITGADINIASKATSDYSYGNYKNLFDILNEGTDKIDVTLAPKFTSAIWGTIKKATKNNIGVYSEDILQNTIQQVYMPFSVVDAKATTTIGSGANIKATKITAVEKTAGGQLDVRADSNAQNTVNISLQPEVTKGHVDLAEYFTGGFIYEDSSSNATVNIDGKLNADGNMNLAAKAVNKNSGALTVKFPKVTSAPKQDAERAVQSDHVYDSPMAAAAISIVYQDTNAVVNVGMKNADANISAGGDLHITASSQNSLSSSANVAEKTDTDLGVAVNVTGSKGNAVINNAATLSGRNVKLNAAHTLTNFDASTGAALVADPTGINWVLDSQFIRTKAKNLNSFIKIFGNCTAPAAGSNVKSTDWGDYFELGASVSVADMTNRATVNLKPTSVITAAGDVAVDATVDIQDTHIVTKNNLVNTNPDRKAGVSASVAVVTTDNTAEVNLESAQGKHATLTAGGDVKIQALTQEEYTRLQKLWQNVVNAWKGTGAYWSAWSSQPDLNKKFVSLQNIIADIMLLMQDNEAANLQSSKKFIDKGNAAIDALTQLTGTTELKQALEAFVDASNYVNMYVSASSKSKNTEATAMATGAVGVQDLHNTANVNIGANTVINAKKKVSLNAEVVESNVLAVGKWALLPDFSTAGGAYGLGGTVGVQNSYNNSQVKVMNGVQINAGSIDIGTKNDIFNMGIVEGGSQTSEWGITGMLSYMGGESQAQTLVDDDVTFTATESVSNADGEADGVISITAANNSSLLNIVGDVAVTEDSAVGVSTGVISYAVKSVAKVENQEQNADGSTNETEATKNKKGTLQAKGVKVSAVTDGTINNITVAGVSSNTQNKNQAAGGVSAKTAGGKAGNGTGGILMRPVADEQGVLEFDEDLLKKSASKDKANIKADTAGSVAWNYVVDETSAGLDNVDITLTAPAEQDTATFVQVTAEDKSYIGAYSGAAALLKLGKNNTADFTGSLAGAVAGNDLNKNTSAALSNTKITGAAGADILNYAHNSGVQVAAGLALGLEVGKREGGVDVNLGGSGSANYIDSNVQAKMLQNEIAISDAVINNAAYDEDVQVAGGLTTQVVSSTASVGAAVAINDIKNNIQALMQGNTIGSSEVMAASVHNIAASKLTQVSGAISVGVAAGDKSYSVSDVAISNNFVQNNVAAEVDSDTVYAKSFTAEAQDGTLTLNAAHAYTGHIKDLNSIANQFTAFTEGFTDADGKALERRIAVMENGEKVYRAYKVNEKGYYVYENDNVLQNKVVKHADGTVTVEYYDQSGKRVELLTDDVKYFDAAGSEVELTAAVEKNLFDLDGSDALANANGEHGSKLSASLPKGAENMQYANSNITVDNNGNTIVGSALGLGVKAGNGKFQGTAAAATSINKVKNNFQATVKNAQLTTAAGGAGVTVQAHADTSMISVAAGMAAAATAGEKISLSLAGSGAAQSTQNNTLANVENSTITTDNLKIDALTESNLVSVAGQVSVETSKQGVAAGLAYAENKMDNTIGAYAKGLTLAGINAGAVNMLLQAENRADTIAVGTGVGIALGQGAVDGAYAANNGKNNTEAVLEAAEDTKRKNKLTNVKTLTVRASDTSKEQAAAGSINVQADKLGASIGGAVAYNNIGNGASDKQRVTAKIADAEITTAADAVTTVQAVNEAEFSGLALGGAVSAGSSFHASAQGSVATASIYADTLVEMDNVTLMPVDASQKGTLNVLAESNSKLINSADAVTVAAGSGSNITAGAAVSVVNSDADTRANIKNSSLTAKSVLAKAQSANDIMNVGMGLSVAAGAGYAGIADATNVASNKISNDTLVTLDNAVINAAGTVAALANSSEKIENYGGGVSVGVGAQGAGVALGQTIVTNTIAGSTQAIVKNSSITALGADDGVEVTEHKVAEDSKDKHKLENVIATKKGFVVNADAEHVLRDISITGGVAVGNYAGAAVDASVVINTITGKTSAEVNNTNINKDSSDLAKADVSITAFDNADISSHLASASVGASVYAGVGAAGVGDRNTVSRETVAQLYGGEGAALNAHDVAVNALGRTKVYVSESGVAAGASAYGSAGVVGSVSLDRFTSNTAALVSHVSGKVHSLDVNAERLAQVDTYNNAIVLSGSIAGGSVGVSVTDVEDASHTKAEVSHVALEANGTSGSSVNVLANNYTELSEQLSADALAVSIGAAAGIAVANINMEATVDAVLDGATLGSSTQFDNVAVKAKNDLYNKYTNVGLGVGSAIGVAVGQGSINMNTATRAQVLGSTVNAANISVSAEEERTLDTEMVSIGAAAAAVDVNVMHTNIGTNLKSKYDYNYDDDVNGGAVQAASSTERYQSFVNEALRRMNKQAEAAKVKTGDSSIDTVQDAGSITLNTGRAESSGISSVIKNSTLQAKENLAASAKAVTNTNIDINQAGVGVINVNVAVNRVDVEDKLAVDIDNSTLKGNEVEITSTTGGLLDSYTGQGGFSAGSYADTTAYVKHHGQNSITIDASTIEAADTLTVNALNNMHIDNRALGVQASLSLSGGRLIVSGEDSAEVSVSLGADGAKDNNITAKTVHISAQNDPGVRDENEAGVNIGLAAGKGTIVESKASGKAEVNITKNNTFTAGEINLAAQTGKSSDDDYYTTEAINHSVGVTGAAITVDKARTYNDMQAALNLAAAKFNKYGDAYTDLTVGASNNAKSRAYITSTQVGVGAASGSNFAQLHSSGKAVTNINFGDTLATLYDLYAYASNSDLFTAEADGVAAGSVAISPFLAKVENTVDTTTSINISGKLHTTGDASIVASRNDEHNLLADSLTVTIAGGGGAAVENKLTNSTTISIVDAELTSDAALTVDAENSVKLNRDEDDDDNKYAQMVKGSGGGLVGANTTKIDNSVTSNTTVDITKSKLQAAADLNVIAHTDEAMLVNGYLYNVGLVGGAADTVVRNNITNNDVIKLSDAELKITRRGGDITLAAADDIKLYTYANAESTVGIVAGADADVYNNINRSNKLDLRSGKNTLYSMQDINLYAGKNADGSLGLLDLDAAATDFVGNFIPFPLDPVVSNHVSQNNQIEIGSGTASASVRDTNLYAGAGRQLSRVTSGIYTSYGGGGSTDFVSTDAGKTPFTKNAHNSIQVDGSVVAGVANKIDIKIGDAGDVVVLDDALRATVTEPVKSAEEIDVTVTADPSIGLTKDSLTFGTEDYASTLYERYNEVTDLMNEYATDADQTVYLGYKAEAERIKNEMLELGLITKTTVEGKDVYVYTPSLKVDYVEIPELTASGGNINIETDDFAGAGTVQAKGTPEISITNNTNLMLKINEIVVNEAGGKLIFNGHDLTGKNAADFNQQINAINKGSIAGFENVSADAGQAGKITIAGLYDGHSVSYEYENPDPKKAGEIISGSTRPLANILIQGNVYAKDGEVSIRSTSDNIIIQGKHAGDAVAISGATVNLDAAQGSITQGYTNGMVEIGGSAKDQYNEKYQEIINNGNDGTFDLGTVNNSTSGKANGSYIAGGNIYINASDINVNGVIQSGFADYYADISDAGTQAAIERIKAAYDANSVLSDAVVTTGDKYKIIDGGAVWDAEAGCYKYQLSVYYNPSTDEILVQNVDAGGGKIYLTGRISSTGNGKIICLDGVSDISIENKTAYDLKLGQLTTNEASGLVSITDTGKNTLTEITKGHVTETQLGTKQSTSSAFDNKDGFNYKPQENLKYTWTTGKETTDYKRYKEDFGESGWGLWDSGCSTEELAKWTKEKEPTPTESGKIDGGDRLAGGTLRVDGSNEHDNTVTISSTEIKNETVKESERKWETGLWGYNKHYEVVWTQETSTKHTYDASLKADNPINVKFIGKAAEDGNIKISSLNNIELTGNIGNTKLYETKDSAGNIARNEKGTVGITSSNGSILQSGGALYGREIGLKAGGDIKDIKIVAGDEVKLTAINAVNDKNAGTKNDIDITVGAAYLAKGNVRLGALGALGANGQPPIDANGKNTTGVTGSVQLTTTGAQGDISQEKDALIVADRIDMTAENGSVYGENKNSALKVYAGQQPVGADTLSASLNVTAKGDISLAQVADDLRIGRIYSHAGDVNLNVAQGSVVDALPYAASDSHDVDDLLARWKSMGIIGGNGAMQQAKNKQNARVEDLGDYKAWDANALLYAIQDSVVNQTSEKLPTTSSKDPNVIGHNITITVADSVGLNSGKQQRIDTSTLLEKDAAGKYLHLEELKVLSKADASTVTWEKDANGHLIAVITEKLPIGVQQTTKLDSSGQLVQGKLTLASTAAAGSNTINGDIFLQGREQQDADGAIASVTKDLHLGNIFTKVGDVTLSSLGGIYNNSGAVNTPLITAGSLWVTAAGGSIGTADNRLTLNLTGTDKNKDGLTAVAQDGIYLDQKSEHNLILRSVSSGGDIFLGADNSIIMGEEDSTEAVNYVRAENDGDITLEARGGSIGEAEYDAEGKLVRTANQGVRILNAAKSAAEGGSKVTLRAKENVFVTGVASADGKTVISSGPAGVLNLAVEGVNGKALANVGIAVDGSLNLTRELQASDTASLYTTAALKLAQNVQAADIYLGSARDIIHNGGSITAGQKAALQAGENILLQKGSLTAANASLLAGGYVEEMYNNSEAAGAEDSYALNISDTLGVLASGTNTAAGQDYGIDLGSRYNKLHNVWLYSGAGNITLGNGGDEVLDVAVEGGRTVNGDILIHNYQGGAVNAINISKSLQAKGNIELINDEGDIHNTGDMVALNGDITMITDNGSIDNEKGADLISVGGDVTLRTKGDGSVVNAGDIVALGGTITLHSENGDVTNYDDFGTLANADGSVTDKYNGLDIATGNIVMSAANGKLYNDKHYLVALGDITLTAKEGLGSYGDVILAGGNITLTDTDGDLFNSSNLVSAKGDVTLNAENGAVINMNKGEVAALNGNVIFNAGGAAESSQQIYYVDTSGKKNLLAAGSEAYDRIIVNESYYLVNGEKHFLTNAAPTAPEGAAIYTQISYINDKNERVLLADGINGIVEAFRAGDVVNRGDIIARQGEHKTKAEAGNVILNSAHGNVTNYDDFKLVKGVGAYDYRGKTGYTTANGNKVKFNHDTEFTEDKHYILSDSGMELKAAEGYLYNDLALVSKQDITLESGKDLTIGTNFASIAAEGNIIVRSTAGSIYNNSSVVSRNGNIILDAEGSITSGNRDSLQAVNGSISLVTKLGEIDVGELFAGETVAAGTKSGNIKIGALGGKDVILYTEDENAKISLGAGGIKVKDHLFLQGNYFDNLDIDRSENPGTLIVDVSGVDKNGQRGTMQGDLMLDIAGDVHFTTMDVNNAEVTIGGKMGIDKLHVSGAGHFTSLGYKTGVYGANAAPYHDDSNALYYDLGSGWTNLYVDSAREQRSDGLLLHIDTYYHSANQRWSAEDLVGKLLDFKPYTSYAAHFGDAFGLFNRYNIIELPEAARAEEL